MRIFLTGASSGIGVALARAYAAREPAGSLTLGLLARRREALDQVAHDIHRNFGQHVVCYAGDVRKFDDVAHAGGDFIGRFGPPDVVIANAGVSRGTMTEFAADVPAFAAVFETNVMGMVHTFQPFLVAMREQRHGTLVGIASVAGIRGLPGSGAYSASKAAAISYLESLRVEERAHDLSVVTICPGYIATHMTAKNPYRMPFLLHPDQAARRMLRVIDAGRSYAVVPWQMAIVARILRVLPNAIYDRAFANVKRKPRNLEP